MNPVRNEIMMTVLTLLESKNRCLQRFLDLTDGFADIAELDAFQERREAIITTLGLYDKKIAEIISLLPLEERTPELVAAVEKALEEKDALIQRILKADDRIITMIEAEKNKVMREVASSHKNMSTLQKFKSSWVAEIKNGEGLDEKL